MTKETTRQERGLSEDTGGNPGGKKSSKMKKVLTRKNRTKKMHCISISWKSREKKTLRS
jgi:hypothetical protein